MSTLKIISYTPAGPYMFASFQVVGHQALAHALAGDHDVSRLAFHFFRVVSPLAWPRDQRAHLDSHLNGEM